MNHYLRGTIVLNVQVLSSMCKIKKPEPTQCQETGVEAFPGLCSQGLYSQVYGKGRGRGRSASAW